MGASFAGSQADEHEGLVLESLPTAGTAHTARAARVSIPVGTHTYEQGLLRLPCRTRLWCGYPYRLYDTSLDRVLARQWR